MPTVIPHNPDGTRPTSGPGATAPYVRKTEERACLSAKKAWWTRKGRPATPPEGATLHVDGEEALRYERVPVLDEAGEVVATRLEWVDLRVRRRQEEEARHLAEAKRAHAASKKSAKGGE